MEEPIQEVLALVTAVVTTQIPKLIILTEDIKDNLIKNKTAKPVFLTSPKCFKKSFN
jgi:hypothetical protein